MPKASRPTNFQTHNAEIEALAIEALDKARMLRPGTKRYELLKQAGRLREQAMLARLADVRGSQQNSRLDAGHETAPAAARSRRRRSE